MHRMYLLLFLSFFIIKGSASAQDLTLDELQKLRASNLSDFETAVMAKGYELFDIGRDYDATVIFKKGESTISYTLGKNPHAEGTDTIVSYQVMSLDQYNALMKQRTTDASHPDITHFYSDGRFIVHSYIDGRICVHFRIRHYPSTLYEISILPDKTDRYNQYSSLKGDINW